MRRAGWVGWGLVGCVGLVGCAGAKEAEEAVCVTEAAAADARPVAHFTPPSGWMNDPSGLVTFAGEHHLFYQRDPHDVFLSDVRWGHAVSTDLSHWRDLPDALEPDPTLGVPFTGSAVVDPNTSGLCGADTSECLVLLFTHAFGADNAQKQSVAYSRDGRAFSLYDTNPVLTSPGPADFRDPKVSWSPQRAQWELVVGAPDAALFYRSSDLLSWEPVGTFRDPSGDPALAGVWECPNLFPLLAPDGTERWVLKVDVNPGLLQSGPSRVWIGRFDGVSFTPDDPVSQPFDGPDFYAAQVFSAPPGTPTRWIGWMSAWSYAMTTPTTGYRGVMSAPRTLSLVETPGGLRLAQQLDDAIWAQRRCAVVDAASYPLDRGEAGQVVSEDPGPAWVLRATIQPGGASEVGLRVLEGEAEATVIRWDGANTLTLDRSRSGVVDFDPDFGGVYTATVWPGDDGALEITALVDRTSVEVFAGGAALTAAVYPQEATHRLSAYSVGGAATLQDLQVWTLPPALEREGGE